MSRLFIDKTIEINAKVEKVWDVLTKSEKTKLWVGEFSPGMILESDWKLGSPVIWKEAGSKIVVEGNVTKIEPLKLLRVTVFDVETGRMPVADDDGMTFELMSQGNKTILHVMHGDFAVSKETEKYYQMTLDAWNKIVPKIKEMAEK